MARSIPTSRNHRHVWLDVAFALLVGGCSAYDADLLHGQRGDSVAADGGDDAATSVAGNAGQTAGAASRGTAGRSAGSGSIGADAATGPGKPPPGGGAVEDAGLNEPSDAAVADGGRGCLIDPGSNYCNALPALPSAPVIDGELECGLRLLAIRPEGWKGAAPPTKTASYAAAWRSDGFYIYVEVHGGDATRPHATDQPTYCGDGVELFVDADADAEDGGGYDSNGSMQFSVAAPATDGAPIDATRFVEGEPQGPWVSKALKTKKLPDGYSVEAFIGGADINLAKWMPNTRIGFSVGIDISAAPGAATVNCPGRAGVYFLKLSTSPTCNGEPWCDVSAFCRSMLTEPK